MIRSPPEGPYISLAQTPLASLAPISNQGATHNKWPKQYTHIRILNKNT